MWQYTEIMFLEKKELSDAAMTFLSHDLISQAFPLQNFLHGTYYIEWLGWPGDEAMQRIDHPQSPM